MCLVHNRLGQNHYACCALRLKSPELRAEISREVSPNSPGQIHRGLTSPVSTLTARFNPSWTVVVNAHVTACVLRIDGINTASTTKNNVGTTSSFKEILAPGNSGPPSSLVWIIVETSFLESNKAGCVSSA